MKIKRISNWITNMGVGEFLYLCWATTPLLYLSILLPLSIKFNLLYLIPVGFVIHMTLIYYKLSKSREKSNNL